MNKKNTGFGVGSSSIIMIFVVLCLTTFSLLSYTSSRASLKFANKSKDYVSLFSEAELKANQILSDIDLKLISVASSDDYKKEVLALCQFEGVKSIVNSDCFIVSYSINITNNNCLLVELKIPLAPEKQRYEIVKWNTFSTEHDYKNKDTIWDGTPL